MSFDGRFQLSLSPDEVTSWEPLHQEERAPLQYCAFLIHPRDERQAYNLKDMADAQAAWREAQHNPFGAWGYYRRVPKTEARDGIAGLAIMGRRGSPKPRI